MRDEIKETIYEFDESVSYEDVERDLLRFYNALFINKRNDIYKDPYKSVMVITRDRCAMKECDEYGRNPHHQSIVNLIRYINNVETLSTLDDESLPFSFVDETRLLRTEVATIRFSAGAKELLVEVDFPKNVTAFQLRTIHHAITTCRSLRDPHLFPKLQVVVKIERGKAYFDDFNDENYTEFDTYINRELEKLGEHLK